MKLLPQPRWKQKKKQANPENRSSHEGPRLDLAGSTDLGLIGLERASALTGRNFTAAETLVIGDTPKDIDCAHAIGAKCLAVATGQFSAAALEAHGADYVVESLDQALARI